MASLFLHERRKITHHLRERDELKHQIDELRRERDVITLHYRAKTEELDKKQKESNEKDRLFAQQKAAVASLETQLSETREYLGATKEEFSKLDKLSKDLPKIKEQRDALVHTLTQLETDKAVLLDQLKKISNANIEKETKAISAANTQTKDLKSSRPPSANRARPVTRPSTRQGLDDGLAPQSTDSGDILRLSTLNTELTTSVGEINLVEADIESLRNNDSFKSAIQLAQERDTLLDRLKRAEIERIKLKSLLNRAKAAPAPTLEEPTKSEEKEKDKKGQSKETKKDKKKDQEEKKEREKEREKETQEAERKLLDQQQKFLEMKELYESVLSREKELKVELERTKLEPSEAEALRHEHLHVIELVEREQVLKNELDKTKGDVAILNEKLNMANKSALENAVNTSNSSGMSATKLKAILDQQSLHEVKSKSLEKEIESSQKKYTDLVKDYGKVCKQLDQRTVEENAQHKSLVMMLEKAQDEKTKIAEELQKVKEDDIKSMSKIMEEKGRLEAFINALKRQLYEKVETIKQEQSKLEKLGDDEKEILNEIRMDEEALVVNEAFLDASRKNNESGRVGELMVQNEKIRSHKILKERELNKTQEKKRAQELLLQELKVLRDYKAQHDGLITSIEKAKAANKMVLVTPQGVITTTMAELKKELLQVAKKKEDLESQMPLPEGWERLVDPSGKMYFMKCVHSDSENPTASVLTPSLSQATKTVQWVHPLSRQATREESSHQESNNALSGLTNGWEEVYDEKHGKFFMK